MISFLIPQQEVLDIDKATSLRQYAATLVIELAEITSTLGKGLLEIRAVGLMFEEDCGSVEFG